MGKAFDFLTEAGTYFIVTTDGDQPQARPFGSKTFYNGKFYMTTSNTKDVFKQLVENPKVCVTAMKPNRDWIRITGTAVVDKDETARIAAVEASGRMTLEQYEQQKDTFEIIYIANPKCVLYESGQQPAEVEM